MAEYEKRVREVLKKNGYTYKSDKWQESEIDVVFSDDNSMPMGDTIFPPLTEEEEEEIRLIVRDVMAEYGV